MPVNQSATMLGAGGERLEPRGEVVFRFGRSGRRRDERQELGGAGLHGAAAYTCYGPNVQ
jgi:hypothetical protein